MSESIQAPKNSRTLSRSTPGFRTNHGDKSRRLSHDVIFYCAAALCYSALDAYAVHSVTHWSWFTFPIGSLLWPILLVVVAGSLRPVAGNLTVAGFLLLSGALMGLDGTYFYFFQALPSVASAGAINQVWDAHASIDFSPSPVTLIAFFISAVFVVRAFFAGRRRVSLDQSPWSADVGSHKRGALASSAIVAASSFAWLPTNQLADIDIVASPTEKVSPHELASPVSYRQFGTMGYHLADLGQFVCRLAWLPKLPAQRQHDISNYLEHQKALNSFHSPLFGIARNRDVVFIQLDSWTEYLVNRKIDGEAITPHFNQLIRDGLYFSRIQDVTLHGRTSDAEFAVMTGLMPDWRKPAQIVELNKWFSALPEQLTGAGYQTSTIHGRDIEFWNRREAHPRYGIRHMYFGDRFPPEAKLGSGASDQAVFEFTAKQLRSRKDGKQFSLVISLSSHHAHHHIPAAYRQLFQSVEPQQEHGVLPSYLRAVRYTDDALGKLFAAIRDSSRFNNTMFVIYGDHDAGVLGSSHQLQEIDTSAIEQDRVPLAILIPGKEQELRQYQARYNSATGSLMDVRPTVLHLLGMDIPQSIMGTHLFVPNSQRPPVPIPQQPLAAAYDGKIVDARQSSAAMRIVQQARMQQADVRDILDYDLLVEKPARLAGR